MKNDILLNNTVKLINGKHKGKIGKVFSIGPVGYTDSTEIKTVVGIKIGNIYLNMIDINDIISLE